MDLQQAQTLVMQLGLHLGGDDNTYRMNENGEAHLLFEDRMEVMIKHHVNALVIACVVAENVTEADPAQFAMIMSYQYLGLNTVGAVLSWNVEPDTLILSRMLHGEPSPEDLERDLNLLLNTAEVVRGDITPMLEAVFFDNDDTGNPDQAPPTAETPFIRV